VNSKIDKRHTMFALEIKKHINDHNARLSGATGGGHHRQNSQPTNKTSTIKIASMPLTGKTTTVAGGNESAVQRVGAMGPDIQDLMARQAQPRG